MATSQPDLAFWQHFHREHWLGDRPLVLKASETGGGVSPVVTDPELLGGLITFRKEIGTTPKPHYNVIVGERRIENGVPDWLPEEGDHSFEHYWSRVARRANPNELFVHLYPFRTMAPASFWARYESWLSGFFATTSHSRDEVGAELFFGNYRKSLIGVHRDSYAIFCFVARGRKRVRVWPPHAFAHEEQFPGMMSYEATVKDSTLLEGGPGDVFFWPSSYWHIAEANQDLALSISVSVKQN